MIFFCNVLYIEAKLKCIDVNPACCHFICHGMELITSNLYKFTKILLYPDAIEQLIAKHQSIP